MHMHNETGEFADFPNQMYMGRSKSELSPMEIWSIVFGILCGVMIIATILTLMHRRKMKREKKSLEAMVASSRQVTVPGPAGVVVDPRAPPPAPPGTSKGPSRLGIHAEESDKEESSASSEEEEETEQFDNPDDKMRFVMSKWMNAMKGKEGTMPPRRQITRVDPANDTRPAPVQRWARIIERFNVEQGQLPENNAFPKPRPSGWAMLAAAASRQGGVAAAAAPKPAAPKPAAKITEIPSSGFALASKPGGETTSL